MLTDVTQKDETLREIIILSKDYDILERNMIDLREHLEPVELEIRKTVDITDDVTVLDAGDQAMLDKLTLLADSLHQAINAAKDAGDHAGRMLEKLNLAAYRNAGLGDVE